MNSINPNSLSPRDLGSLDGKGTYQRTAKLTRADITSRQNADVTIVTADGDEGTLSSSSYTQAAYMTYDGMVRDSFPSSVAQVLAGALEIGGLQSVSSLEASLQFEERTSLERRFMRGVLSPTARSVVGVLSKANAPVWQDLGQLTYNLRQVIKESGVNPSKIDGHPLAQALHPSLKMASLIEFPRILQKGDRQDDSVETSGQYRGTLRKIQEHGKPSVPSGSTGLYDTHPRCVGFPRLFPF